MGATVRRATRMVHSRDPLSNRARPILLAFGKLPKRCRLETRELSSAYIVCVYHTVVPALSQPRGGVSPSEAHVAHCSVGRVLGSRVQPGERVSDWQ